MSPILRRLATFRTRPKSFSRRSINTSFQWDIPEKFNFAQDVIDANAKDATKSNLTAFHHVSIKTGTRKWTFKELSNESQIMASALLSLGKISRALIMLPR